MIPERYNEDLGWTAPEVDHLAERADRRMAARALSILRILLLPIIFAGDRLVAHPTVGTKHFDEVLIVAFLYSALMLAEAWRPRGARLPAGVVLSCDLLLIAALTYESGGAFSQLHAAFLALPLGAALLLSPKRTALVSVLTGVVYLIVAVAHPATSSTKRVDVVLAQGLYVLWVGCAAVLLSSLLSRRRQRILDLATARGRLVAQAVDAEERARRNLSDDLHDHAIQNVLTARQDLADVRAGDMQALDRAEQALRLALNQLRSAVRELHPYLLDHLDLVGALETIAEQHASRGGYRARVEVDPAAIGVDDQLVMSLARELLANAAKHAGATKVAVTVTRAARAVILEVSDDGRGFTRAEQLAALRAGHIGLASSRERVEASGGRFEILTRPGGGTLVRCTIPIGDVNRLAGQHEIEVLAGPTVELQA